MKLFRRRAARWRAAPRRCANAAIDGLVHDRWLIIIRREHQPIRAVSPAVSDFRGGEGCMKEQKPDDRNRNPTATNPLSNSRVGAPIFSRIALSHCRARHGSTLAIKRFA